MIFAFLRYTGDSLKPLERTYDSDFEKWWIEGKPWTVLGAVLLSMIVAAALAILVWQLYKRIYTTHTVILSGEETKTVKHGAPLYPPIPKKDGYTFCGWFKDSACTEPWGSKDRVKHNLTLYPKWTKES